MSIKYESATMEIEYNFRTGVLTDNLGSNKWYEINIEKLMVYDKDIGDWVDKTDIPRWIEQAEDLLIDVYNNEQKGE